MMKKMVCQSYELKRDLPMNIVNIKMANKFIFTSYRYQSVYVYNIDRAYVTPYGIVFNHFRIVRPLIYSFFNKKNYYLTLIKKIIYNKVKRIKGNSIVISNVYFENYYHFTTECLPRLFLVKEYSKVASVILKNNAPSFVKEYLDILGFENIFYINEDELALADHLIAPMFTADALNHNPVIVANLSQWIKLAANTNKNHLAGKKNIYLSRKNPLYRTIINEEPLIAMLQEFEFEVLYMEDYCVSDQIALMSTVINLVSIHGAGMANMIYMPKGGVVIDLIHENHADQAFYNLCCAMNHSSVIVQGKSANIDPRGPAYDSFFVDVSEVKNYLNMYIN